MSNPVFTSATSATLQYAVASRAEPGVASESGTPPRARAERALALSESAEVALAFSSGLAAGGALLQTLSPGDHVVVCRELLSGGLKPLVEAFEPLGVRFTGVDAGDPPAIAGALRTTTRLIWVSQPGEPWRRPLNLPLIAGISRLARTRLVVEVSALAGRPRPIALGADAVLWWETSRLTGLAEPGAAVVAVRSGPWGEQLDLARRASASRASVAQAEAVCAGLATLSERDGRKQQTVRELSAALRDHPWLRAVYVSGAALSAVPPESPRVVDRPALALAIEPIGGWPVAQRLARDLRRWRATDTWGNVATAVPRVVDLPLDRPVCGGAVGTRRAGLVLLRPGVEEPGALLEDLRRALDRVPAWAADRDAAGDFAA